MAFHEALAERIRHGLVRKKGIEERKKLSLLPSQQIMRMMAKAAVAVYGAAVDGTEDRVPDKSTKENRP
jgi:hypothetical protein